MYILNDQNHNDHHEDTIKTSGIVPVGPIIKTSGIVPIGPIIKGVRDCTSRSNKSPQGLYQ